MGQGTQPPPRNFIKPIVTVKLEIVRGNGGGGLSLQPPPPPPIKYGIHQCLFLTSSSRTSINTSAATRYETCQHFQNHPAYSPHPRARVGPWCDCTHPPSRTVSRLYQYYPEYSKNASILKDSLLYFHISNTIIAFASEHHEVLKFSVDQAVEKSLHICVTLLSLRREGIPLERAFK